MDGGFYLPVLVFDPPCQNKPVPALNQCHDIFFGKQSCICYHDGLLYSESCCDLIQNRDEALALKPSSLENIECQGKALGGDEQPELDLGVLVFAVFGKAGLPDTVLIRGLKIQGGDIIEHNGQPVFFSLFPAVPEGDILYLLCRIFQQMVHETVNKIRLDICPVIVVQVFCRFQLAAGMHYPTEDKLPEKRVGLCLRISYPFKNTPQNHPITEKLYLVVAYG